MCLRAITVAALARKTYEYLYRCEAAIQQAPEALPSHGLHGSEGEHNLDRLRPGCVTRAHQRPTASPFTVWMHFGFTQRVIRRDIHTVACDSVALYVRNAV